MSQYQDEDRSSYRKQVDLEPGKSKAALDRIRAAREALVNGTKDDSDPGR